LLALFASLTAKRFREVSMAVIALVIVAYQTVGSLIEWGLTRDLWLALQDVRMAWPGMIVQLVGGWLVLKGLSRK
ncbi:MAG: ECF transporter S component, partial [Muribaculaceae bacterium]|nr:ECF transporter S component [Muribaculaceae bacterium]